MKKKRISIVIAIILIIGFILSYVTSYANDGTMTAYLAAANSSGIGYAIGNPTNSQSGYHIWEIVTKEGTSTTTQRNLYCIKAKYGTTWNANESSTVDYNLAYDLQADRKKILDGLVDNGDSDDVVRTLLNPDGQVYKEILWILDNAYIDGETDKNTFLTKAGINLSLYEDENGNVPEAIMLTADDIRAVQRAAIWYFTNYVAGGDSTFNNKDKSWLTITTDSGASYNSLSSTKENFANTLYNYLVDTAIAQAGNYTLENNYTINAPVKVDTSSLTQEDDKYQMQTTKVGSNFVVGPIILTGSVNSLQEISMVVTDQKGTEIEQPNYTITDSNGTAIENATLQNLIGRTEGFYISVPQNLVQQVNIKISVTNVTTQKTLWLKGTETNGQITLDGEQPIVEITREPQTTYVDLTANTQEFDLALRKYITEINETKLADLNLATRAPKISKDTLQTGTTATYNHKKDPVVVKENDVVTYSLTIFNEGSIDGYASQIIDQLPTGLIYVPTSTVTSIDKTGTEKNTYTVTYEPTTNRITLDIVNTQENPAKSVSSYIDNTLDYETITIKCKVVQEVDEKVQKILTNVAWISGAKDSNGATVVDRDSQPETSPNVNSNNMENYKGNDQNQSDLSNSEYFYQGKQDDDDFEKLVLMPVTKKFDLALFKHIAAISKDQNIEPGEYLTDTGNIDGTYLRAPVVTNIDQDTGIITYKEDDKEALTVEPGDYVLYTIRVYNEGEIDGYASKIKDTLPIGLEFVVENEEYNGIWKLEGLDADGRQVITTTNFAKGKGAELNSVEGDENYTANLLKALNPKAAISNDNPDYIDAQVLCKVVEDAKSDRVLVNYAQISDDSDAEGNEIDDIDSTPDEWIDTDDDQDIERIKLQCFDLALRKFITSVNDTELKDSDGKYIREPKYNVTPLKDGSDTTAIYTHPKTSVSVQVGDKVVYTIRVYNEGDIKGYASEVTDYLPPYLTYVTDSKINEQYGWQISEDGRIAKTTYLKDKELDAFDGTKLDYEDIKIECIISDDAPLKQNITNIAEISEYKYNGNVVEKDIDSTADDMVSKDYLPEDKNLPTYKDDEINKTYVPGNEDDDDFEKVYVKDFDLALRKFITKVGKNEITSRVPQVKTEDGKITYEHPKEPITLHVDDVVIYTLRIYNEGEISGYASKITDDIPEYLEYLPENSTNVEYMWKMYDKNDEETENVEDAVKVKTEYLSKDNGTDNLIKAYDGTTLYYKDIKIAFKVKDPNSNTYIITNHAQISDDTDEKGNQIKDKDSVTDVWNEGEDDQDIENVKVEYFDLALLKFVSKVIVIEDGKETITETGYNGLEEPEPVVKVELHRKKLNQVTVKFGYGITITNQGDIAGYANEITDYIPEGLKFEAADNPEWTDEGNGVISTRQLEGKLLQPGESATVEVILTWINGADNLAEKTNIAEISEDDNEYDVPDRDSTPDNQIPGEDDIDIAKVILTISTGAPRTYFTLALGLLTVVLVGVALIKRFVL